MLIFIHSPKAFIGSLLFALLAGDFLGGRDR
jgi:hypothetical protein